MEITAVRRNIGNGPAIRLCRTNLGLQPRTCFCDVDHGPEYTQTHFDHHANAKFGRTANWSASRFGPKAIDRLPKRRLRPFSEVKRRCGNPTETANSTEVCLGDC